MGRELGKNNNDRMKKKHFLHPSIPFKGSANANAPMKIIQQIKYPIPTRHPCCCGMSIIGKGGGERGKWE
jgi:hypothetical protein